MFGRTHSFGTDEIPVAVCNTADDVRRAVRRNVPRVPVVRIELPEQEQILIQPPEPVRVANPTVRGILTDVCEKYQIGYSHLIGRSRAHPYSRARQEASYRLRVEFNLSLPQIARILGGKDHTTIGYSIGAHARRHSLPMPAELGECWQRGRLA